MDLENRVETLLLDPDLPEEVKAHLQARTESVEAREYIPPTAEQLAQTQAQVQGFVCTDGMDVPLAECEALVALYYSTTGAGWVNSSNWLITSTIGDWYGITLEGGHVKQISLYDNQLTGLLPSAMGNLTQLKGIALWNNHLTGQIPSELGDLTNLTGINISRNQLNGMIPAELVSLTNLTLLDLSSNQLSGQIPAWLGNLTGFQLIDLSGNQLTGTIPPELGNLWYLRFLILNDNLLTGSIPTQLGNLTNVKYLYLGGNHLTGSIPLEFGNLTILVALSLSGNQLTSSIPSQLGNLLNLSNFDLSDNALTGDVPASLTNLAKLCAPGDQAYPCPYYKTDLGYNQLTVPAPEPQAAFLAIKDPDWYQTQAVEETIPDAGGTLVSNDQNTTIIIPADATEGAVTLLFDPQPAPSEGVGNLDFAGNSFTLTAMMGEIPVITFAEPLVLTLHYDETSLGVIPEDTLTLYYWDEGLSAWTDSVTTCAGGEYTRNLTENWLSLPICHLSEFAFLGEAFDLYLPIIRR